MSRATSLAAWVVVALLAWPWACSRRDLAGGGSATGPAAPSASPSARWLGPVGALAASWEWVRWTTALRRGELARAHTHAARALALDPVSPDGWLALAQHLVFDRSAAAVEADRGRRTHFARAGLDVLRRGEERSRDAAGLALIAGDLAVFLAERAQPVAARASTELDPEPGGGDLDWPGGPRALLDEAAASYARARDLGHPAAAERLTRLAALR